MTKGTHLWIKILEVGAHQLLSGKQMAMLRLYKWDCAMSRMLLESLIKRHAETTSLFLGIYKFADGINIHVQSMHLIALMINVHGI